MKYDLEQIRKEFRSALSKVLAEKGSQKIDEDIYLFIYEKVLKEIQAEDYKEIDDFIWRVFTDTISFMFDYGLVLKEVLSESRKELKEEIEKELRLNEEYKNLIDQVLRLRRYENLGMQKPRDKEDLDA